MQTHHFHHHLVGVGGAVEGAGADAVIRGRLGLQQRQTVGLALGVQLAHAHFFLVRQAAAHRAGRHEQRGQVAEGEGGHHQPRHDLVADAEEQRAVEHIVRQADGGRHGDHVAAHQRQLHAVLPLRHPVAHRRHAAGHLAHGADRLQRLLQPLRVVFVRLVGRQHVIVSGDDGDIAAHHVFQRRLVIGLTGGEAVGQVAAGELRAVDGLGAGRLDTRQIGGAAGLGTVDDALCDTGQGWINHAFLTLLLL